MRMNLETLLNHNLTLPYCDFPVFHKDGEGLVKDRENETR